MKVLICYFSGTGNTRKVAEEYACCFEANGHSVSTTSIDVFVNEKNLPQEFLTQLNDADLFGIGFPVHAFNAPEIVLNFAKRIPKSGTKKRTFLFSSSGEPLKLNNISSVKLCGMLKRRNYTVTSEYHYCMPYNIMFRHSQEMAHKMWTTAQQLIPLDVAEICQNTPHRLEKVFCGGLIAWIMRCEFWGGRLNGKQYKVFDSCIHCEQCVNICPTHNITIEDGHFKFGKKCLMCMRCAHLCPKNAIKIGWFNKWKVNGKYNFEEPLTHENQKYNKMLTNAYAKYFSESEARIAENNQQ